TQAQMFAGLLGGDGGPAPGDLAGGAELLAALSPDSPPDATGVWCEGPFLLVQARRQADGRDAPGPLPYRCAQSGRVVAFWGRLDDREALAKELGRSSSVASDEDLVLAAHERWGASCPERLTGDFAGAICDPRERRALLFRDRLGVKPLYYRLDGESLLFATTAAVFAYVRRHPPVPDSAWMARSLAGVPHGHTATGWTGVVKLAPCHRLDVHPGGIHLERYHSWRDEPSWTAERDSRWVEEYRTMLEEAIRCRMR